MNRTKIKGYSIKQNDVSLIKGYIACKHFGDKRGIGYAGKWIFLSLSIYFSKKYLRHRCNIDGMFHIIFSDDVTKNGNNCKYFESILSTSYSNLSNAVNDITL